MFETKTYEALLASAWPGCPPASTSEGSMVMNGVAPSMAELAQLLHWAGLRFPPPPTWQQRREYLIKRR
ncbi:MAG: hypothetical protein ACLSF6_06170 [Evtepia gabavorous]